MPQFADLLAQAVQQKKTPVLVGLDPRYAQLPAGLQTAAGPTDWQGQAAAYAKFCRGVIDVVAPLVPAVKPQAAFFEQLGPPGLAALAEVIRDARNAGLLVVLDGKRGDIGSTAAAYADAYLGAKGQSPWGADALTVNPYLGDDSLTPFVDTAVARDAGIFVLVKTSNPGGKTFQDLLCPERPLYQHVAQLVEQLGETSLAQCGYHAIGAVVGATYPEQLAELRAAMRRSWFLVPGFGAQGGTAAGVAPAFDSRGLGAIVNNSRGIIFAHARLEYAQSFGDARWQQAVEAATITMIEALRADTPAGQL